MKAYVLGALLLAGCTHVSGWVEGRAIEGESWKMVPDRCFTGQRLLFNGVELESTGADPHGVMVVADPIRGASVVVVDSSTHERRVFDASNCAQFEPHLYSTASRLNGYHLVSGSITLACGDSEHSLRGTVAFENCH